MMLTICEKEGIVTELIKFAFTGVNIIPTMILILMQCYWLVAITGFFDFDFFDFDVDLEGAESVGPLGAIAVFINIGQVPVALVFSLYVLNFWIIMMLTYFLPIKAGGFIAGMILLPALIGSLYITKAETVPLKRIFPDRKNLNDVEHKVLTRRCTLLCDLEHGRLGQASLKKRGASIVINVETLFEEESFTKGEVAFVFSKDKEEDKYYIAKSLVKDEMV